MTFFVSTSLFAQVYKDGFLVTKRDLTYAFDILVPKGKNDYEMAKEYNVNSKKRATLSTEPLDKARILEIPISSSNLAKYLNSYTVSLYYKLQENENIASLASQFDQDLTAIQSMNHKKPYDIKPGDIILIGYIRLANPKSANSVIVSPTIVTNKPSINNSKIPAPTAIDTTTATTDTAIKFIQEFEEKFNAQTMGSPVNEERGATVFFNSGGKPKKGVYYAFSNTISIGTIVRIKNPANNIVVYAKVIGEIPNLAQYNNCVIAVSAHAKNVFKVRENRMFSNVQY